MELQGEVGEGIEGAQTASLFLPGDVAARGGELLRRRQRARSDEQWGRGEKVTTVGRWQLGHLGRPGAMEWAEAQGKPGVFLFFSACFSLLYFFSFIYFLSVLFHFRAFRYFVKLCPLHHNYLCNIWQPPNIFVLTFENFCLLTCLEF